MGNGRLRPEKATVIGNREQILSNLRIELKPGESVSIGTYAVVTLEEKSGKIARLSIRADRSVPINRMSGTTTAQIAQGGIMSKTVA